MDIPEFKSFSENSTVTALNSKKPQGSLLAAAFEDVVMEIPPFKFFTDGKDLNIPFKLDEKGLAGWFKSLHHTTEPYYSCQQIYRVIKALNAEQLPPGLRFAFLDFLGLAITPLVNLLEQPLLEAKIPPTDTEQAHHEIITATYALMALGFWRVVQDAALLQESKEAPDLAARAIYAGLGALRKVLLFNSELYEQPLKGFWKLSYQFYWGAEQNALLDHKIGDDADLNNSIAGSFKNLLVFYLSGPNQCKPKSMKMLFNTLGSCMVYAKIYDRVESPQQKLFFSFVLDQDAPPACRTNDLSGNIAVRFLDTKKIAKLAYDNLNDEASVLLNLRVMKQNMLVQLVKNLGMGQHRKFVRVAVNKNYSGIIGYENILHFLRNAQDGPAAASTQTAGPKTGIEWKVPDLQLVPLLDNEAADNFRGWQKIADDRSILEPAEPVWLHPVEDDNIGLSEFEIVNSNVKGYGLLFKEQQAKIAIGEFVAIRIDDENGKSRFEIGIIRRISQVSDGCVSLGVELIAASGEAVCVYPIGNVLAKHWAILLRGIKAINQPDGIVYETHCFKIGDHICMEQGRKTGYCQIKKVLHSTASLTYADLLVQR